MKKIIKIILTNIIVMISYYSQLVILIFIFHRLSVPDELLVGIILLFFIPGLIGQVSLNIFLYNKSYRLYY
jgi:hypothetical protein